MFVQRNWLEERLLAGMSFESIAREVGLDPRTVGYWAEKHGLRSQHAERHAPRGALSRERLEALIGQGLSVAAMARELKRCPGTVKHWLDRYELETLETARRRKRREALVETEHGLVSACELHGVTGFFRRDDGGALRCKKCQSSAVVKRRRKVKEILIADAGGCCVLCGYSRVPAALQFHHLDRMTKSFALSRQGVTRSLASARAEAQKCVLLCANCHAEIEVGAASIPRRRLGDPG